MTAGALGLDLLIGAATVIAAIVAARLAHNAGLPALLVFLGLRGAVPIVLATIPLSAHVRGATRLFDLVPTAVREQTERRLRAVSRAGKLAGWFGEHGL